MFYVADPLLLYKNDDEINRSRINFGTTKAQGHMGFGQRKDFFCFQTFLLKNMQFMYICVRLNSLRYELHNFAE